MPSFPFIEEYQTMIDALKVAREKINEIDNAKVVALRNRISLDLDRNINFLLAQSGQEIERPTARQALQQKQLEVKPLTHIFGKPIKVQENTQRQLTTDYAKLMKDIPTSKEVAAAELKTTLDALYPKFNSIDTPQLLDSYSDLELRGIAKMAGMQVTESKPKKIDARYVERIKEAITMKAEIDRLGTDAEQNSETEQKED